MFPSLRAEIGGIVCTTDKQTFLIQGSFCKQTASLILFEVNWEGTLFDHKIVK